MRERERYDGREDEVKGVGKKGEKKGRRRRKKEEDRRGDQYAVEKDKKKMTN
jgi:hypothetical protein